MTQAVETVFVMFKCHVDLGFTDTEQAVLRTYVERHLPAAVRVARTLRDRGGEERLVWTVPAWVLHHYLSHAPAADVRAAEEAIAAGDLAWHALPFTWYTELLDQSAVRSALTISRRLDERFGRRTTAARLTDVPGHTRGLVGPLAQAGVTFLDIGCNPGCTPPAVPFVGEGLLPPSPDDPADPDLLAHLHSVVETPTAENLRFCVEGVNDTRTHLFVWQDVDGERVTVLYHPHNYGSTVRLPGTTTALSMRVHLDNLGPHSVEAVDAAYASLRAKFPGARIVAADLSMIGDVIAPLVPSLPVLTQEIGDSWIYGTGADPAKTAATRELLRVRREWLAADSLKEGDDVDIAFVSALLPAPEHNWGLSTSAHLGRWDSYEVDELRAARSDDARFGAVDGEWDYKRQRPLQATEALPAELRAVAQRRLTALTPRRPNLTGLQPVDGPPVDTLLVSASRVNGTKVDGAVLRGPGVTATVSAADGSLTSLVDTRTTREWADDHTGSGRSGGGGAPGGGQDGAHGTGRFGDEAGGRALVRFCHQTFDVADYARFNRQYNTAEFAWFDFGKPGLDAYAPRSGTWRPSGAELWSAPDASRVVARLLPPTDVPPDVLAPWPAEVWLDYRATGDPGAVTVTLTIIGKPACRAPEAFWLSFEPAAPDPAGWRLDKLGQQVDPRDVVDNGGRMLHGVGRGATYTDAVGTFELETLDAHLIAPGRRTLLQFDNDPIEPAGGMHVNLYNNLWGTAFPQWYDHDMTFRFHLAVT